MGMCQNPNCEIMENSKLSQHRPLHSMQILSDFILHFKETSVNVAWSLFALQHNKLNDELCIFDWHSSSKGQHFDNIVARSNTDYHFFHKVQK